MWDAWAAYDADADGFAYPEKHKVDEVRAAREVAISFAAYRILDWRYRQVSDLATATDELSATMTSLCLDPAYSATDADDPAAVGNRIAETVLALGAEDGSLEETRYVDPDYVAVNEPLVVSESGNVMVDPTIGSRWRSTSRFRRTGSRSQARCSSSSARTGDMCARLRARRRPTQARRSTPGHRRCSAIRPATPPIARPRSRSSATAAGSIRPTARRSTSVPGAIRQQHARHERRQRSRTEPRDRRAVRSRTW